MRPQITFYQLNTNDQTAINQAIGQLAYKHFKSNRRVYILCPNQEYCYQLDEYFIGMPPEHFFPFQLYGEGPIPPAPICLGFATTTNLKYDILINLHSSIPADFIKYREVIELVALEPDLRVTTREHYKHYHKFNCPITFNQLTVELSTTA